jgi:hypothetical protein
MKTFFLLCVLIFSSTAFSASDSQVEVVNNKDSKAIKISGPAAKQIYDTLKKLSAHGDYKFGTGITCTSSSKATQSGNQCVLLLNADGIK